MFSDDSVHTKTQLKNADVEERHWCGGGVEDKIRKLINDNQCGFIYLQTLREIMTQ